MGFLDARMTDKMGFSICVDVSGEITRFFHLEFTRASTDKNEAHLHVREMGGGLGARAQARGVARSNAQERIP